jgi:hypothetical protein
MRYEKVEETQYHPCAGGVTQFCPTTLPWSKLGAKLVSELLMLLGTLTGAREAPQQYGLGPAGHTGALPRAAMAEAETLVAKAMAATKEMTDCWKSIVESVVV